MERLRELDQQRRELPAVKQDAQPVQVGLIIKETLKLLHSTLPSTIQINAHIDSSRAVLIAPTQMHQIMMNLCTNAKHAMEENGGVLTVALSDVILPPTPDSGHRDLDLPSGSYVKLTIKDTGHGMAPDIVKRIFDPYFTTKEKGAASTASAWKAARSYVQK